MADRGFSKERPVDTGGKVVMGAAGAPRTTVGGEAGGLRTTTGEEVTWLSQ